MEWMIVQRVKEVFSRQAWASWVRARGGEKEEEERHE